jgi:hypothetical protein
MWYIFAIMLKRLAILSIAFLAIPASVSPQNSSRDRQDKGQAPPPPSVTIEDNSSRQTQADCPTQKSPESHAGVEWSNWALVFVGAITFIAVGIQANESRRATKAMRDSIRLQERAMEQWVVLDNWKCEIHTAHGMHIVSISVELINQTDFPLVLKSGELEFKNPMLGAPNAFMWGAGQDTFLPPKIPYVIPAAVSITGDQAQAFSIDKFVPIRVAGMFLHIGALKRLTPQEVLGTLLCRHSGPKFEAETHMNPQTE